MLRTWRYLATACAMRQVAGYQNWFRAPWRLGGSRSVALWHQHLEEALWCWPVFSLQPERVWMDKTVNIIGQDNGGGLSRDVDVLRTVLLEFGWSVAVNEKPRRHRDAHPLSRFLDRVQLKVAKWAVASGVTRPTFELNIHLEEIDPECLPFARRNILIPNHEWFRRWQLRYLRSMDEVWVKTHVAERPFADLGCRVRYLGWTSLDKGLSNANCSAPLTALHIAGRSGAKGTEALLDAWGEHPRWPLLRVLRREHGYDGRPIPWRARSPAANVQIITDRVEENALAGLQHESAIHLCPSEVEGFGHIIHEAMSVGALVITTDAPPMNEMITPETGLLVAADHSKPQRFGRRYYVNRADLATKIQAALDMTEQRRRSLGRAARVRFEEHRAAFRARLALYLESPAYETRGDDDFALRQGSSQTQTPVE